MLSRVSEPVRYNWLYTRRHTGRHHSSRQRGDGHQLFVATADSVAAEAFGFWSQIGTVPPRF